MIDHEGKVIEKALPSMPVEILGMNDTTFAGAEFLVTENEDEAKKKYQISKKKTYQAQKFLSNDKSKLFDKEEEKNELNIIIKSDVHGSSEALKMAIDKIKHPEVKTKIILSDIGMINETDVSLAKASEAVLIGFNIKPNREAKKIAEDQNIEIKYFNIIYEAIEYVEKRLSGLLEPDTKENLLGSAEDFKKYLKYQNLEKLRDLKLSMVKLKINLRQE